MTLSRTDLVKMFEGNKYITVDRGNQLVVDVPFDESLNARLKTINGRWDPSKRKFVVPNSRAYELLELSPEILALNSKARETAKSYRYSLQTPSSQNDHRQRTNKNGCLRVYRRARWRDFHDVNPDFPFDDVIRCGDGRSFLRVGALLHKSAERRGSPFPGQTYPTASVTGMPSAV